MADFGSRQKQARSERRSRSASRGSVPLRGDEPGGRGPVADRAQRTQQTLGPAGRPVGERGTRSPARAPSAVAGVRDHRVRPRHEIRASGRSLRPRSRGRGPPPPCGDRAAPAGRLRPPARASAALSTSTGARSSPSPVKALRRQMPPGGGRAAAGRAVLRMPPVATSCPAPAAAIEIPRCTVAAARSANGRGGARLSGLLDGAPKREHAVGGRCRRRARRHPAVAPTSRTRVPMPTRRPAPTRVSAWMASRRAGCGGTRPASASQRSSASPTSWAGSERARTRRLRGAWRSHRSASSAQTIRRATVSFCGARHVRFGVTQGISSGAGAAGRDAGLRRAGRAPPRPPTAPSRQPDERGGPRGRSRQRPSRDRRGERAKRVHGGDGVLARGAGRDSHSARRTARRGRGSARRRRRRAGAPRALRSARGVACSPAPASARPRRRAAGRAAAARSPSERAGIPAARGGGQIAVRGADDTSRARGRPPRGPHRRPSPCPPLARTPVPRGRRDGSSQRPRRYNVRPARRRPVGSVTVVPSLDRATTVVGRPACSSTDGSPTGRARAAARLTAPRLVSVGEVVGGQGEQVRAHLTHLRRDPLGQLVRCHRCHVGAEPDERLRGRRGRSRGRPWVSSAARPSSVTPLSTSRLTTANSSPTGAPSQKSVISTTIVRSGLLDDALGPAQAPADVGPAAELDLHQRLDGIAQSAVRSTTLVSKTARCVSATSPCE